MSDPLAHSTNPSLDGLPSPARSAAGADYTGSGTARQLRRRLGTRLRGWRRAVAPAQRLRWWSFRRWLQRRHRFVAAERLHIGCGEVRLEGWCNIDIQPLPTVDVCFDVTRGLPFGGLSRVFAEHFLEHLEVDDALDFLVACHGALANDGWLRLSTPNLDWVWTHLYDRQPDGDRVAKALHLNRAFYGWRHRFLWNRSMLDAALRAAGFDPVRWCAYGESQLSDLRGLERHSRDPDSADVPHVLVVEAGKGVARPAALAALRRRLDDELLRCRL